MSAITGITFDAQNVSAKQDGRLYAKIINDGIVTGCEIVASGSTVTVGAGTMVVGGRVMELEAAATLALEVYTGVARLIVDIDLSREATTSAFEQAQLKLEYAADEASFDPLLQEDINADGNAYQYLLGVLTLVAGVASSYETRAETLYLAHTLRRVNLSGTATINVADNTLYVVSDAVSVTINCPSGEYNAHVLVKGASGSTPAISISGSAVYDGTDLTTAAVGDIWEFSILDGYVLGRRWLA